MVRQGQGEAEFPQKQLETAFLHSLRLMDQNREYLQMHLAPAADSRAAQALDDMAVESARLERTFREVMELSAPEQPLHKLPLDLCQLVSQMARMEEEIKAQCGTTLRADCGGLTQCLVWGDRAMAEQICFHLLSNALHAVAPGGSITVGLRRTEQDVTLFVEDDGCGLPEGESWLENRRRFLGGVAALPPVLPPTGLGACASAPQPAGGPRGAEAPAARPARPHRSDGRVPLLRRQDPHRIAAPAPPGTLSAHPQNTAVGLNRIFIPAAKPTKTAAPSQAPACGGVFVRGKNTQSKES